MNSCLQQQDRRCGQGGAEGDGRAGRGSGRRRRNDRDECEASINCRSLQPRAATGGCSSLSFFHWPRSQASSTRVVRRRFHSTRSYVQQMSICLSAAHGRAYPRASRRSQTRSGVESTRPRSLFACRWQHESASGHHANTSTAHRRRRPPLLDVTLTDDGRVASDQRAAWLSLLVGFDRHGQ